MDGVRVMESLYTTWGKLLTRGFKRGEEAGRGLEPSGSVVFCGMGGSGVTGDIAGTVLEEHGVRVWVSKSTRPPSWIGPGDLLVGVSYSGNTLETLECVERALGSGTTVVAITSGGRLASLARSRGLPLVLLSEGYYPRTAMAEMVGAALGLARGFAGIDPGMVEEAAGRLGRVDLEWLRDAAGRLAGSRFISVVSCGGLGPAARRIRSELAENSKIVARDEVYPESGHNDIVSWQAPGLDSPGFLMVRWRLDGWCSRLLDSLEPLYSSLGLLIRIDLDSPSLLSALLEASLAGGLISVYLAGLRRLDPRDTSLITRYKESLREAGGSVG